VVSLVDPPDVVQPCVALPFRLFPPGSTILQKLPGMVRQEGALPGSEVSVGLVQVTLDRCPHPCPRASPTRLRKEPAPAIWLAKWLHKP
jgi:hypothetical protein